MGGSNMNDRTSLVSQLAQHIDHDEPPGMAAHALARTILDSFDGIGSVEAVSARVQMLRVFGVSVSAVNEEAETSEACPESTRSLEINDRVYRRRSDLFGRIVTKKIEGDVDFSLVKFEPPYDQNAEPTWFPDSELVRDYEVTGG
jgi:hypothetical protein